VSGRIEARAFFGRRAGSKSWRRFVLGLFLPKRGFPHSSLACGRACFFFFFPCDHVWPPFFLVPRGTVFFLGKTRNPPLLEAEFREHLQSPPTIHNPASSLSLFSLPLTLLLMVFFFYAKPRWCCFWRDSLFFYARLVVFRFKGDMSSVPNRPPGFATWYDAVRRSPLPRFSVSKCLTVFSPSSWLSFFP